MTAAVIELGQRVVTEPSLTRRSVNPDASAEHLILAWSAAAQESLERGGNPTLTHLGVAIPGPFDYRSGISRLQHKFAAVYGLNLGAALLERVFGEVTPEVKVLFGNDGGLFTLGEWWAGVAQGHRRVMGATLGTGLGGGFVQDGKIRYGGDHLPPNGAIWNLPYRGGIAEDYASGDALIGAYLKLAAKNATPAEIARAARTGDPAALEVYAAMGQHLSNILKPWVGQFCPSCVVVGGNIARSWSLFGEPIEAGLGDQTQVVVSSLFEQANLLGAAALWPRARKDRL